MGLTSTSLFFLILLRNSVYAVDVNSLPRPADPFADPANDPFNPLRYIASNALTGVFFSLVLIVGLSQTALMIKYGAKWMLAMTIGCYTFAFGIGTRFGLHFHPESKGLYIIEYLFVVLSPCAFIAALYVLLGRMARHLKCDHYLLVSPKRITVVFISSDITTFLIQAAGGAVSISANQSSLAVVGSRIFLAGLAAQLASFAVFTCIYLCFLYRVRKFSPDVWVSTSNIGWYKDWRTLAGALIISCIGILIRSLYRTIELSQGFEGPLAISEGFFYGLDTSPLFVSIAIMALFWPGKYIPAEPKQVVEILEKPSTDSTDTSKA